MKNPSAIRIRASAILLGAVAFALPAPPLPAQTSAATQTPSPVQQAPAAAQTQLLLDKAHALEVRGRTDMAAQTWQQVLLADPNNTEALGGLARAAKLSGNAVEAQKYIDKLKQVNPNDPGILRAETMGTQTDHNAELAQAGKLAQQGQYAEAMRLYRKLYGDQPPAGDIAMAYYETEAATEDGRPHAIAGLRALVAKNPGDSRFQVALGRILTYNPKTREEGRKLLEAHQLDPQAVEALRQSLLWDSQNPASTASIRDYLAHHSDAQLSLALKNMPKTAAPSKPAPVLTAEQKAEAAASASRNAEEQAAYRALNAKHLEEAEQKFKAILANNPESANALAGMGYIRMQQANFGGALSFLVQAKQDGSKDPGLDTAINTSRFWYTMGEGATALNANDLPNAEKQYRSALSMRPDSVEALEGLGGTLLKAQQPEAAVPYFAKFVKLKPTAPHAWRGLFLAQFGAGDAPRALASEKAMPPAVRAELYKDPLYLRSLSSAYTNVGDDADAQKVIRIALDLPFPADARGLEAETQLQYAGLLQAANHLDQAAGLYRQVLAKDPNSTDAWQGLVRTQHAMGQDEAALQSLESMPQASYAKAMREPGFDATVAGLYETHKRYDVAQEILEKAIANQVSTGQKPSAPTQLQLAGVYMERNNPQQAYPIYRQLLTEYPDRTEAWKGLISTLHNTGRDTEAIAEVPQIPPATRAQLENDVDFLQTVGAAYNALGQPQQAELFLHRVQEHYALQHTAPPADVDIQNAWLLYNGGNDAGLDRQLLTLGGRTDLTDPQRRTIQTIWANWAVRRSNQAAANGDTKRALMILNATARAFPDNPGVIKALAGGYSRAGLPTQSVKIWKAQDLTTAPASDYKAAIGAALAAGDQKDAETWLRFALDQYPKDPELLNLGAKFEAARGDTNRAADYYRAQLDAMPPPDPGAELATELSRPVQMTNSTLPSPKSGQDLATLLAPNPNEKSAMQQEPEPVSTQPYLPSYGSGNAPVQMFTSPAQMTTPTTPVVPSYMTAPGSKTPSTVPPQPKTKLKDYVPQASLEELLPSDATSLPDSIIVAYTDFSGPMLTPAVYQQQQITRVTQQAQASQNPQQPRPQPLTAEPTGPGSPQAAQAKPQDPSVVVDPSTGEVYRSFVPYTPTKVDLGSTPAVHPIAQPEVTDVLPKAKYVPNAKVESVGGNSDVNAANAAAIRRRQSDPPITGESRPPVEEIKTTQPAQYGGQVAQPMQGTSAPQQPNQTQQYQTNGSQTNGQTGDSNGQQYPQPGSGNRNSSGLQTRGRVRARATAPPPPPAATVEATTPAPAQYGLSYPGVGTPLGAQPYPSVGGTYPLGPAPTDYDLLQHHLPPLRGNYYTGEVLTPQVPLTPRQQAQRDLDILESSYSGWIGGTASARYRSGTAGLDRMTDLTSTVEASATLGNGFRVTIVPKAVFLNSGVLNTGNYAGLSGGSVPVLGTLSANALNAPGQQSANGIGGELQVATRNFAAALGYTPYEFLVRNFTGRGLYQAGPHFKLYFNRDSVMETQVSYAGLRDPGSPGATFGAGSIWGGVMNTGGGIRFDMGDEKAGFYITADGSDLTGYHVLENTKFEGSAGAYFLAHVFPGYGKINVGASIFGMHFSNNERSLTYGLGGYFSPDAYFLASVPITFTGHYSNNFHYTVAGSLGVQTFQEDSQKFFPLDPGAQTDYTSGNCTQTQINARTCGYLPNNSNTGANYGFNTEGVYRITDHWFGGGFFSANNTNNYNTVTGGFFVRYTFRSQPATEDTPTGMFPVEGFRPLRVP